MIVSRKKDMPSRVLETCQLNSLFDAGDRVLVAVSGGADSIVLLDCLCRVKAALKVELAVGHVDHGLRETSASEAMAVKRYARSLGLKAYSRRVDVASWAKRRGQTIEEAGRVLRTAALKEMAKRCGARLIATGHTATDQAETVLMRLIRGTGPLGLAGIVLRREDGFVRPLLCTTREEVRAYAAFRRLPVLEDETNRDEQRLRNWVRHKLLPVLRQKNPRIEFALSELAEDAADLDALVDAATDGLVQRQKDAAFMRADAIDTCDRRLLPYLVNRVFLTVAGPDPGLSRTHINGLVRLINAGQGRLNLPRGIVAEMDRSGLKLSRKTSKHS